MNKLTSLYTVDGYYIYEPHVQISETDEGLMDGSSGRTDDGVMHVRWIRRTLHKFSLQYNQLTAAEYEYMKNLLQGRTFRFGYWDKGQTVYINAYCEATGGALTGIRGMDGSYSGVQFDIIEL